MITSIKKKIKSYWDRWIKNRNTSGNPQVLGSHNIYILPSGFGWTYGLVVLSLFSGAINYQISTVFLMTFLLAVIGLVSAWEAHANLKELSIKLISIKDVQQGTPVQITLLIQPKDTLRFGFEFQLAKQPKTRLEKIPTEGVHLLLPLEASKRGCFNLPPIIISSLFPFGIFRVWGYAYFNEPYYVYPAPVSPDFWPPQITNQKNKNTDILGDEEFYDLKQVENPWVQPNLIAWKIAAKGQGWYLKTKDSSEGDYWLFQLNDLPTKDIESQLQNLSYWLQTAELNGQIYGLKLANTTTQLAHGKEHLHHCLRQLALYQ